jgi:acyl-ACP thioesterase
MTWILINKADRKRNETMMKLVNQFEADNCGKVIDWDEADGQRNEMVEKFSNRETIDHEVIRKLNGDWK